MVYPHTCPGISSTHKPEILLLRGARAGFPPAHPAQSVVSCMSADLQGHVVMCVFVSLFTCTRLVDHDI